jgi:hypothetical protein
MNESVDRCGLDLRTSVVLTEAAAAAYVVTPILAALAGASHVYALTRSSRFGTVAEVTMQTRNLAAVAGVDARISVIVERSQARLGDVDIVTNSGHVRPIDRTMIDQLKSTAVIALMYESWEFRSADLDLGACKERGIPVAGTNERHSAVDVFSYLGIMAVKLLVDAGVAVYANRVLVVCDNPFSPYIERGLTGAGASVDVVERLSAKVRGDGYDAILIALRPGRQPRLGIAEVTRIREDSPGAVVVQFFGDIDREAFASADIPIWPLEEPPPGHMGILPSAVGPDPIVRLQTGGLKVGELLWRARCRGVTADDAIHSAVDAGFADSRDITQAPIAA